MTQRFPALAAGFAEGSIRVGAIALDRENAIEMAGELLVASGRSTPEYTQQMLAALVEHGPYMVIAPGIALVHGFAAITQRGNQIVSGVAINMLAAGLTAGYGVTSGEYTAEKMAELKKAQPF